MGDCIRKICMFITEQSKNGKSNKVKRVKVKIRYGLVIVLQLGDIAFFIM